ncbi:potassium channel family protein [Desulfococcaceae bacterium HSG7]|nr:potassium channel family protein [Desulfococcaceae bacterium HSG7]
MGFTLTFIQLFLLGIHLILPLLLFFALLIIVLGQIVGRIEGWNKFDSFYWSFITALTVGYGDIRPIRKRSKTISILIALIGFMFTGVFVAITVATATEALKKYIDLSVLRM